MKMSELVRELNLIIHDLRTCTTRKKRDMVTSFYLVCFWSDYLLATKVIIIKPARYILLQAVPIQVEKLNTAWVNKHMFMNLLYCQLICFHILDMIS